MSQRMIFFAVAWTCLATLGCTGVSPPRATVGGHATQEAEYRGILGQMATDGEIERACANQSGGAERLVGIKRVDLNRDGISEYKVIGQPGCACIGARRCAQWVYQKTPTGYSQLLEGVQPDETIAVLSTRTRGYADLSVVGWSGDQAMEEIFRFNGRRYVSTNPRVL